MGFIQSVKDTLNNLVDKYNSKDPLPEKNVDFRYAPAPAEMGDGWKEIQKYNTLTGETIPAPRKVYALVWTPEAIKKLQDAYKPREQDSKSDKKSNKRSRK